MLFTNRKLEVLKNQLGLNADVLDQLPDELHHYTLPDSVITRASCVLQISESKVKQHQKELFMFLMIASETPIPMLSTEVDVLWHEFILCTKEYLHFCFKYLGKFVHHNPNTDVVSVSEEDKAGYQILVKNAVRNFNTAKQNQLRSLSKDTDSTTASDSFFWGTLIVCSMLEITAEQSVSYSTTSCGSSCSTCGGD